LPSEPVPLQLSKTICFELFPDCTFRELVSLATKAIKKLTAWVNSTALRRLPRLAKGRDYHLCSSSIDFVFIILQMHLSYSSSFNASKGMNICSESRLENELASLLNRVRATNMRLRGRFQVRFIVALSIYFLHQPAYVLIFREEIICPSLFGKLKAIEMFPIICADNRHLILLCTKIENRRRVLLDNLIFHQSTSSEN